jgi:hypothetical protein
MRGVHRLTAPWTRLATNDAAGPGRACAAHRQAAGGRHECVVPPAVGQTRVERECSLSERTSKSGAAEIEPPRRATISSRSEPSSRERASVCVGVPRRQSHGIVSEQTVQIRVEAARRSLQSS